MATGGWTPRERPEDEDDDPRPDGGAFGTGATDGWMTPKTPLDLFRRDAIQETREEARQWALIEAALHRADHAAACRASAQRTWDAICADWRRSLRP